MLEREPLDGAEEVSGWVFYNEQGVVARREPLDRVELQPAVRGIGRVNGEPVTNLAAGDLTGFAWPVPDYTGVSRWKSGQHKGADLMATRGSEVLAMAAGTVTMAQWHYSYGNVVEVDHGNGLSTLYAHLESMDVAVGTRWPRASRSARWAPPATPPVFSAMWRSARTARCGTCTTTSPMPDR